LSLTRLAPRSPGAQPQEPFARFNHHWEETLGFQTDDPVRDLRGARALGLKQLVHFCSTSGNLEVITHGGSAFPLAAASLNVTLMLCSHLGLLTMPAGGSSAIAPCSDDVILAFMRLHAALAADHEATGSASASLCLDLMHTQCLRWLLDRWERLDLSPRAPRIMQFPALLRDLRAHIKTTLPLVEAPWSIGALLLALRQEGGGVPSGAPPSGAAARGSSTAVSRAISVAVLLAWVCPPGQTAQA